jgi:hypothetical protein
MSVIEHRAGTRIWLAAGVTDPRQGFHGLSAQVQTVLNEQQYSGQRMLFGMKSEKLAGELEQSELQLEELETSEAAEQAAEENILQTQTPGRPSASAAQAAA